MNFELEARFTPHVIILIRTLYWWCARVRQILVFYSNHSYVYHIYSLNKHMDTGVSHSMDELYFFVLLITISIRPIYEPRCTVFLVIHIN